MTKIWIIVLLAAGLLLLALGGTTSHHITSTDAFCSSCHAYEKASWDHGSHATVGCLDCHSGGFVRDKTQGLRKVYLVFTGQIDPHHDRLASYPDKTLNNCTGCHLNAETAEQHPHFTARHGQYMEAAETCIACHEGGHVAALRDKRYLAIRRGD